MKRVVWWLLLIVCLTAGCARAPRWQTTRRPDALDAAAILASDTQGLRRGERPNEVPLVPMRERLRPCCAFGSKLRVRVGPLNIPGLQIKNIQGPDQIGHHNYDAGQRGDDVSQGSENNGLVYTCRGGFIDIAHVRDYADWTLYLATQIGRHLETGRVIDFPQNEGGRRRFVLKPVDPELVQIVGRRSLAAPLGVWAGFQLSIWHEIATWYGWASFDAFSERASAFSPEDLYSNMLGAKLVGPIITAGDTLSEGLFDRAVDAWVSQAFVFLGGVDAQLGEAAIAAVDGLWWNSAARLPDADLVLRRSIQLGPLIEPWQIPAARMGKDLHDRLLQRCGGDMDAHVLRNPSRLPGIEFADVLTLEVELSDEMARHPAFRELGRRVTQEDFPRILESIREEMRREFGPMADSPEVGP